MQPPVPCSGRSSHLAYVCDAGPGEHKPGRTSCVGASAERVSARSCIHLADELGTTTVPCSARQRACRGRSPACSAIGAPRRRRLRRPSVLATGVCLAAHGFCGARLVSAVVSVERAVAWSEAGGRRSAIRRLPLPARVPHWRRPGAIVERPATVAGVVARSHARAWTNAVLQPTLDARTRIG